MKMSVGLVAVALLLAGCGGDPADKSADSTATATGSGGDTMSATAWSRQVEAICVKSAARASTAGEKLGRRSAAAGDSKQELAYKVLRLQSKLIDPWMDRVEALPKPEGRERDANRFIASMRDIGDLLGRTATAIEQNDRTNGSKLVRQLQAKTVSARDQAKALGIEKCNPSPNQPGGSA
jgi:hypothetical protein